MTYILSCGLFGWFSVAEFLFFGILDPLPLLKTHLENFIGHSFLEIGNFSHFQKSYYNEQKEDNLIFWSIFVINHQKCLQVFNNFKLKSNSVFEKNREKHDFLEIRLFEYTVFRKPLQINNP